MKNDQKPTTTENENEHDPERVDSGIDLLEQRIEELENQVKRTLADYQNLEKRVAEEKREWIVSANKELLLRILPVLDTLRMASEHSDDENLRISLKQFDDILKGEGVSRIETVGKDFDPATMECVTTEDGQGENNVTGELQAGYMLGDKVLRPARVKVGKASN